MLIIGVELLHLNIIEKGEQYRTRCKQAATHLDDWTGISCLRCDYFYRSP